VAVNKMDSCGWDKDRFDFIQTTLRHFLLEEVGFSAEDIQFVPCSGLTGENLVKRSSDLPEWLDKRTLEDYLDELPASKRPTHKPLRIVVSEAYKSMQLGPFAVGGKIEAGIVRVDDTVLLSPLNLQVKIKVLLVHGQSVRRAKAGENVEVGLGSKDTSLGDQLGRAGIVICDPKFPVPVVEEFKARVLTLAALKFPILNGSHLIFHAHSVAIPCTVKSLERTLGPDGKVNPRMVRRNETAEITLTLSSPVCLERQDDFRPLSRFLLRFSGSTIAAGAVIDFTKG
jgi:elongation factor 1 alpha-like protein